MKLGDFLIADAFVPEMASTQRDEVIAELVGALVKTGKLKAADADDIIEKIIEREKQGSTGIGKGIAVPHVKHPAVKSIIGTVGGSTDGVDFASLDKAPVYSVLLLISPPNEPEKHLEVMEKLFSHLQKEMFRKFLRQAETKQAIAELIHEADDGATFS